MKNLSKMFALCMVTMALSAPLAHANEAVAEPVDTTPAVESNTGVVGDIAGVISDYYKFRINTKLNLIELKYDVKSTFWNTVYGE